MEVGLKGKGKFIYVLLFSLVMLLGVFSPYSDYTMSMSTVDALPSTTNKDGGNKNGTDIDYLVPSDFTGAGYKESRGVFKGDRNAGFTCWAYGTYAPSYVKTYSNNLFNGKLNTARGGLGDEAFIETDVYNQCKDNQKLLEYEIFAGDVYEGSGREPTFVNGKLRLRGWSALGGFRNHKFEQSSVYVVAVEQVGGKNTTNANGVHISKGTITNDKNLNKDLYYEFGITGDKWYATDSEYNRFRGFYRGICEGNASYCTEAVWQGDNGKDYHVYGLGKNMDYEGARFSVDIDLNKLFVDETKDKEYKLYLVKRVNDMIVSANMAIPKDTTEYSYNTGKLRLDGNAVEAKSYVYPNRTGIVRYPEGKYGDDAYTSWGDDRFFTKGERLELIKVKGSTGVSNFVVKDRKGKVFEHKSHYFDYPRANEGALLSYKAGKSKVTVNHYDITTIPNATSGSINFSTIRNDASLSGVKLKEKATLKTATKGTGNYLINKSNRFDTYNNGELYRSDTAENYVVFDTSAVRANKYLNYVTPSSASTLNLFYIKAQDILNYRVNYVGVDLTKPTAKEANLVGKDKATNKDIKQFVSFSDVIKGTTVSYENPETIVNNVNGIAREWDRISGQPTQKSTVLNSSGTLNIKYQLQPIVTVNYRDAETKQTIKTEIIRPKYASNVTVPYANSFAHGGKTYYRLSRTETSKEINNIDADQTLTVDYVNREPITKPETYFYEGDENPTVTLDKWDWNLTDKAIKTEINATFDGKHASTRDKTVKQAFGKNKYDWDTTEDFVDKNGMFKTGNISEKVVKYAPSNPLLNKSVKGTYDIQVSYEFTNHYKDLYKCDLGEELRCFTWNKNGKQAYWGEDHPTNKLLGKDIVNKFLSNASVHVKHSYGSKVNGLDKLGKYETGRTLKKPLEVKNKGNIPATNETLHNIHYEQFDLGSSEGFKNGETQGAVEVYEELRYKNGYKDDDVWEKIPKPTKESRYLIGNIDKNLEGTNKVTVDKKVYWESKLTYDEGKKAFKLADVYGLSKDLGIQVKAPRNSDKAKEKKALQQELDKVIEENGYTKDTMVDFDFSKESKYYMPIDDKKYTPEYIFKDKVELNGIGYNELTITYDKEFKFGEYLYGNVMDDPLFTEQKEGAKKVTKSDSKTYSQEDLKNIKENIKDRKRANLFRVAN